MEVGAARHLNVELRTRGAELQKCACIYNIKGKEKKTLTAEEIDPVGQDMKAKMYEKTLNRQWI